MQTITNIITAAYHFSKGWKHAGWNIFCARIVHQDKQVRENISEKSLDHMLADTFPASDPVTMY
ncbi:MAG: hypothetical protein U1E36_00895 [Rickettsiales bacterium]